MFKIDGVRYNMLCSIERNAEIRSSDISGFLMDKSFYNDPIGTYLSYTITIAVPVGQEVNYSDLYETLTNPVAEHSVEVPYNQGTITIKGRISTVSDRYYKDESSTGTVRKVWRGTKFVITSNYPQKVS